VSYAEGAEQPTEKKGRKEVVAELVPGGEKDSVVYLGKSSFKMKVGVRMTPPAGTAPTVPPTPRVSQTPRPTLRTPPSAHSGAHSRPGTAPESQSAQLVQGVALAKSTLVGLCLTAFSCGIMCTVAVDRYWPRARTECVGAQPGTTHAAVAPPDPVIEAPARPALAQAARSADVVSLPPYGEKLPTADKVVAVEAAAVAPAAVHPTPAPVVAPAVMPRARPVASPSPAPRIAAPARLAPAQGRTAVRKRPGPATAAGEADRSSSSPTETWTDPFAE
jgi:hypothetical protein